MYGSRAIRDGRIPQRSWDGHTFLTVRLKRFCGGTAPLRPRGTPTTLLPKLLGAFVATVGAFGPSFLFVTGFLPYFARVRENDAVQTALTGVNAAVVGAILGATLTLAREGIVDLVTVALAVATFVLFVRGVDAVYLILAGGGSGIATFYLL